MRRQIAEGLNRLAELIKVALATPAVRQMINKARLDEGSRLLLHTELPITEIALRCGYTDHSAFSRQFRALTGLSPSQYRDTQR